MRALQVKANSLKAWVLALRPKTLSAGAIPILVGSFTAPLNFLQINWGITFCALLVSFFLQAAVNFINDALDFEKGADTKDRIGPIRVTQKGLLTSRQVMTAGMGFLVLAFFAGIPLILKGGTPLLCLVLVSIICSYLYTGGPYPLSYNGLGELFVLLFYGFGAVLSVYYLQVGYISFDAIIASLQIGFLATLLIAINNLRDIKEDSATGKRTLAVRFGVNFAKWEITFLIFAPFVLNFYWSFKGKPLASFLPFTAFLIAWNLASGIWKHDPSRLYNRYLGESSLLLCLFGILLILGLHAG